MGLETGTFISDLVATNPTGLDVKSQGDDHLRLIKSVLKATFPNANAAINPTVAQFNFLAGPFTAGNYVRAAGAATLGTRTPAQVRSDIGADDASNLTSGTIPDARLSANVPLLNASNAFSGAQNGFGDGLVSAPSLTFVSDPDTGHFRVGANEGAFAAGGEKVFAYKRTSVLQSLIAGDGSKAAEIGINGAAATLRAFKWYTNGSLRFSQEASTTAEGGANAGSDLDLVGYADDGSTVIWRSTFVRANGQFQAVAIGSAATPDISFRADPDTGIRRSSANILRGVAAGEDMFQVADSAATMRLFARAANDQTRYSIYRVDTTTERGYFGFVTASDDKMSIRNAVGTTIEVRIANVVEMEVVTDAVRFPHRVEETGVISPASIGTTPTNDYNPSGLSTCTTMRLQANPALTLNGLVAQAAGTKIRMINIGSFNIVLTNEAAGSTAANRFLTPNGATWTLNAGDSTDIWYDSASSRWRVIGGGA